MFMQSTKILPRKLESTRAMSFGLVDEAIVNLRNSTSHEMGWIILGLKSQVCAGETDALICLASGQGDLSSQEKWPDQLFHPNTLCYGMCRMTRVGRNQQDKPQFISFCWKGSSLPVSLRTKFAEYNSKIQTYLKADASFILTHPDDLKLHSMMKLAPRRPHRRSGSKSINSKSIVFSQEVLEMRDNIRSDDTPFNWMVCRYANGESSSNRMVQVDAGMTGLFALKGIGGIITALKEGERMYIYLRVDVPIYQHAHHDSSSNSNSNSNSNEDKITQMSCENSPSSSSHKLSKFVLITWLGSAESNNTFDKLSYPIDYSMDSDGDRLEEDRRRRSILASSYSHTSDIYQFFPHHIHFYANNYTDIREEAIQSRIRTSVDNDSFVLRVVCIQSTGEYQSPVCIEIPWNGTVSSLRASIESTIGLPRESQMIVYIHTSNFLSPFETTFTHCSPREGSMLRSSNHSLHSSPRGSSFSGSAASDSSMCLTPDKTEAIVITDLDTHTALQSTGLSHGDKIYVEDVAVNISPVLEKLVRDVNDGSRVVSLSAERRHEVEKIIEAREAELESILDHVKSLVKERKKKHKERWNQQHQDKQQQYHRVDQEQDQHQDHDQIQDHHDLESNGHQSPQRTPTGADVDPSKMEEMDRRSSMQELEERIRVLESHNKYLEIPYENIRILEGSKNQLGVGKAATVYRGLWVNRNGTAEVAIKVFRYNRLTDTILANYRGEVAMLRKLKHPNIMLFIGACTNPKLMILTEYCSRGSLYSVLNEKKEHIPWKYKVRMMLDGARGIEYLHSKYIIHRDIKSHNFLVDDEWRLKVADFGISKVLEDDNIAYTQCGTTGWVAPEVLADEEQGYSSKADNWSFAIVMWEMVAGKNQNLFIGMAPVKFYNQTINSGLRPKIDDSVNKEYAEIIQECWRSNPSERPSFKDVVQRLEKIAVEADVDISLPPSFEGGYHAVVS